MFTEAVNLLELVFEPIKFYYETNINDYFYFLSF